MKQWGLLLLCSMFCSGVAAQEQSGKLTFILSGPAEFLVVDPQGRREGIDSMLNYRTALDEIPGSYYGTGGAGSENPDLPGTVTTECEIGAASHGTYRVHVTGTSAGTYRLDIFASNPPAGGTQVSFLGVVTRHRTETLRIDFNAGTAGLLNVARVMTMTLLRQDIRDLFAAGLLEPERFYRELIQKVRAMERLLSRRDSDKVYPLLREFRKDIERVHERSLNQEHPGKRNRNGPVISEDAFRILMKDVDLLMDQSPRGKKERGHGEREDGRKKEKRERERD